MLPSKNCLFSTYRIGAFILTGVFFVCSASAENASEWRGINGDGVVQQTGFPEKWSPETNIVWRTPLPAPGNSSPIVFGEYVFVTCANVDGTERSLIAFDRKTGKQLWKESVFYDEDDPTHATNPWCAATPATDGECVFVWNGSAGATAYDYEGNKKWHRDLGVFNHRWGHASSPRIYGDTVIYFGSPGPRVILTALNRKTGETVWERFLDEVTSPPEDLYGSFVTPLLWANSDRDELLIPLPGYLASFDPSTGDELWRCRGLGTLTYTDAMVGEDVILAFSGYRGPAFGMKMPSASDAGDLTDSHRIWFNDTVIQRVGSGVIVGDQYFLCGRKGELHSGDIYTGETVWQHNLREQAWSAISLVDDKLWLTDQGATTYIFEPTESWSPKQVNKMSEKERTNSTLVFLDDKLYLRTHDAIYAIGE